ncbi:hypothetical protein Ae201684P_000673 [Aphanomyces euteiches]|uniref:PH domain-containing protein n=1 Tax=Aphanomyces euteiches TaxID=100861 RepID=A0A6G0XRM5_9STRA|nr:hypothetical protein Ae201684_002175 [Aphanomyces euteiches]KAH9087262.1 hypothetical protein Ae201684P_000673 [Aphanomyces euteiches]KAH9131734.1 hypothetical protein AeRB84_021663 [Aphanomyces euteiches]
MKEDATRSASLTAMASPPSPTRVVSPTKVDPKLLSRLPTLDMLSINQNKSLSVRDRIREMHALKLAPFPADCHRASVVVCAKPRSITCCQNNAPTMLYLDLHGLSWKRRHIATNDLVGASIAKTDPTVFVVHYALHEPTLAFQMHQFEAESPTDATAWIDAIQTLVKWHARVPLDASRRIQVVLDAAIPSTSTTWTAVQDFFRLAAIDCTVVASYDLVAFGASIGSSSSFEATIVVGSSLSFHRVVNGLFTMSESTWRAVLPSMPLGLLQSPDALNVVFKAIKRKVRPRDLLACHFNHEFVVLATTTVEFGSMSWRTAAPALPSLQFQAVAATRPSKNQDEMDGANVNHQHFVELCSVYYPREDTKSYKGRIDIDPTVKAAPSSTSPPVLGLRLSVKQDQAVTGQWFTHGSVWHRWTEHRSLPRSSWTGIGMALPQPWAVAIDGSPPRLVSGHIQVDCVANILHCFG